MTGEIHPATLLREVVRMLESTRTDLEEDIATLKSAQTVAFLDRRVIRADSLDRLLDAATAIRTQYAALVLAGNEIVDHINATPIWSDLGRAQENGK